MKKEDLENIEQGELLVHIKTFELIEFDSKNVRSDGSIFLKCYQKNSSIAKFVNLEEVETIENFIKNIILQKKQEIEFLKKNLKSIMKINPFKIRSIRKIWENILLNLKEMEGE